MGQSDRLLSLNVERELDWTVVGAHYFGMDVGILQLVAESVGAEEVVDAPAGIVFACMEAVGPP